MVVAKVRPADMPVEVLGLDVQGKYIREKPGQALRDRFPRVIAQVCGRGQIVGRAGLDIRIAHGPFL